MTAMLIEVEKFLHCFSYYLFIYSFIHISVKSSVLCYSVEALCKIWVTVTSAMTIIKLYLEYLLQIFDAKFKLNPLNYFGDKNHSQRT